VLLLEQHDFGKGTSSRSTKLAHGGIRYLARGEVGLVREALRERELLPVDGALLPPRARGVRPPRRPAELRPDAAPLERGGDEPRPVAEARTPARRRAVLRACSSASSAPRSSATRPC
jgi:hypothetical protein